MTPHNKKPNRLINEKSPYLLQHAYNPVDWYPWGEDAFTKAKREDKPVFLSIGYSTCHWCHVMEKESFEDEETARLMNDVFVSIKVDREERPDIDNIYMLVCQIMTGSGGWPLSIVMTPDKKPFFSGTYFPKENRYGRIGFNELINNIRDAWKNDRTELEKSSDQIISYLNQSQSSLEKSPITEEHFKISYKHYERRFDSVHGGFGTQPKFPSPHNLLFLLRYWKRNGDKNALDMVVKTLSEMRMGGIFDHVGFGFHRYSTDDRWLVPHFEKMLYDQAILIIAYTETFQATQNPEFKETAGEIITYVLRDMTSPEGGFYSAEDADSEGVEGKFYVWTKNELIEILGKDDSEIASIIFNVTQDGNFHEESSGQLTRSNILHLTKPIDEISSLINLSTEQTITKIESIRKKLFDAREKRIHPYKDDKILTDWNGLMIAALSKACKAFGNMAYINSTSQALEFIEKNLVDSSGTLLHSYRNGEAKLTGNLDDFAFLIWALIEMYEATFEKKYIERALQLTDLTMKHFWDSVNGGFYFTPDYAEKLITRTKEFYDGAIPSGNSVMLSNLLRLSRFTADINYENAALKLVDFFSNNISRSPSGSSFALCGLDFLFGPSYEIVVVNKQHNDAVKSITNKLNALFISNKILIFQNETNSSQRLPFEYLSNYKTINDQPTVYVCKNFTCNLPTNDLDEVLEQLGF